MHDLFITDFDNLVFQRAFKTYFAELGVNVSCWGDLWEEMNRGNNVAFLKVDENQNAVGLIQCQIIESKSWFFKEHYGFIREFWVRKDCRNMGYGTQLLALAEQYFLDNEVVQSILTTDSAEKFYLKHGYKKRTDIAAKNNDAVFVKMLQE